MLEQAEVSERLSTSGYPPCREWTPPASKPQPSLSANLAQMSHDLRIPLAAILANAEFLAMSNLREGERDELYEEIRFSIARMNELVSEMLECSKGGEPFSSATGNIVDTVAARREDDWRTTGIPAHCPHSSPRRIGDWLVQLAAS